MCVGVRSECAGMSARCVSRYCVGNAILDALVEFSTCAKKTNQCCYDGIPYSLSFINLHLCGKGGVKGQIRFIVRCGG